MRVRILGNLSYLPADLRETVREVERVTEDNTESLLNIALSYTAREEITHAVRELAVSLAEGKVTEEQVDEARLERLLYTGDSPVVDLLIRTSGETRLSDFMLWQASKRWENFLKNLRIRYNRSIRCTWVFVWPIYWPNQAKGQTIRKKGQKDTRTWDRMTWPHPMWEN